MLQLAKNEPFFQHACRGMDKRIIHVAASQFLVPNQIVLRKNLRCKEELGLGELSPCSKLSKQWEFLDFESGPSPSSDWQSLWQSFWQSFLQSRPSASSYETSFRTTEHFYVRLFHMTSSNKTSFQLTPISHRIVGVNNKCSKDNRLVTA